MTTLGTFGYDASAANEYQYDTIGSNAHGPFVSMGSHMRTSIWNTPNGDSTTYEDVLGWSLDISKSRSVCAGIRQTAVALGIEELISTITSFIWP